METAAMVGGVGVAKPIRSERAASRKDRMMLKRQALEAMMEQWRQALDLFSTTGGVDDDDEEEDVAGGEGGGGGGGGAGVEAGETSAPTSGDCEADEIRSLLKSRVECLDFLEKIESTQASFHQNMSEGGSSWDMVNENDLWEGGDIELENEDYVLVRQEDIVDGIACFMAAYLLSLEQTKDLTPNQIQQALSKTFSVKKKKGKLRKAWDGSKVIYNVASWGATAIGIYQNPALLRVASEAFWSSCRVISKFF